jgi:hypothetical protein
VGFLDPGKILVILVLALIVLGPDRLPKAARQAGAAWRELTRVREQVTEEIRSAMPDLDLPNIPRMPTNVVSGFIADLTKPSVRDVGGDAVGANGVESEVQEAPGELISSSSTGETDETGEASSTWPSESAASGGLAPPGAGRDGGRSAARAAIADVPLASDDPSMN